MRQAAGAPPAPAPLVVIARTRRHAFFTPQAEPDERPRDRRDADRQPGLLFQVGAQLFEGRGLALPDLRAQQLLGAWPQPGRVAAAVRARGDVLTGAVQVEQLVDEGGADAEQFDHLAAGAVAAQGGDQNFLPPV